jgi:phage terminase large subunit-like protein
MVGAEALRYTAMRYSPIQFARALGFELDPWQKDVVTSTEKQVILRCSRQSGKSLVAQLLALHTALFEPHSLIFIISPSQRQSGEMFKHITTFYEALDRPVPSVQQTALTMMLANGSRIVSLPSSEHTIRGYSAVRLVILDEASRCPPELYGAIRPFLAVSESGRLIMLSTPLGHDPVFYETWEHGEGWQRVMVTAEQCPRISQDFLASERVALGEWLYLQEYMCEWQSDIASFFNAEEVDNSLSDDVLPL